jgi:TPR repeat protein
MVVRRVARLVWVACLSLSVPLAPVACSAQTNNASSVVAWERQVAESGDAAYQTKIGLRYRRGDGVEKNEAEAVKWFHAAAEQGNANAAVLLASAYLLGSGIDKDLVRSYMWYELAIARLEPDNNVLAAAVRARADLAKLMTPAQIREAIDRVSTWQPKRAARPQ